MKTILTESRSKIPYKPWHYTDKIYHQQIDRPQITQKFTVIGDGVEFEVKMISKNGFNIPTGCDVDAEMKFTFTPKTPKSETITLK